MDGQGLADGDFMLAAVSLPGLGAQIKGPIWYLTAILEALIE